MNTRWKRQDCKSGHGYTVVGITNLAHQSDKHPPQVVYQGDNGNLWSMPLANWPGSLVPQDR